MKKPKLLFVDDEKNIIDDLEEIFGYTGKYDFLGANSGQMALELLEAHKIDLVITDIKMPEMDGLQLATQVRQKHSGVKIIFITAVEELIGRAVKVNPVDVVEKPIRSDILLHKVEKYFESKNSIDIGRLAAIAGGVLALLEGLSSAIAIIKESSFVEVAEGLIVIAFLIFFVAVAIRLWRV